MCRYVLVAVAKNSQPLIPVTWIQRDQPLLFLKNRFCPLELNISTLGQNVTVNSALNLSCVNISFMATFNTERQPGDSAMKVSSTVGTSLSWCDKFTQYDNKNLFLDYLE